MQLRIARSDRVDFFGRTGSGKTTLARSLLRASSRRFVVFDPKHMYRDGDVPVVRSFNKGLDEQIVRVDPIGGDGELDLWDEQFYLVWQAGDRIVYVDEATLLSPPRTILPEYGRCLRTGREKNVATWTGSQRPKDIPSVIFTEAEHFFLFRLQWEADRSKVASFTSDRLGAAYRRMQHEGRAAKHDFLYYGVDEDTLLRVRATRRPGGPVASPAT